MRRPTVLGAGGIALFDVSATSAAGTGNLMFSAAMTQGQVAPLAAPPSAGIVASVTGAAATFNVDFG